MPRTHTHKTLFKEGKVEYEDYRRIVKKLQKKVIEELCEGKLVVLPKRLGRFFVAGKKRKTYNSYGNINLSINWGATEKLWRERPELWRKQYVYLEDQHSDGYSYGIYHKPYNKLKNSMLYKFKVTLFSSQALKDAVMNGAEFIHE